MALLNAVVLPSKTIKGGKNKVRISVAHNGDTRYIVTDIILDSNKEFKNGIVVKRPDAAILNTKIRRLLQKYQSILDELEYINGLSAPELVFQLMNFESDRHRTLKSVFEEYMIASRLKEGSKKTYNSCWKVITKYIGEETLMEHITRKTILIIDKNISDSKISSTTARGYMSFLRIILNHAIRCGYVQYRIDPFAGYKMPPATIREAWLTVDEIKKIRDLETNKKNIKKCRDLFMLSYYLGGINITDLLNIDFDDNEDYVKYEREKMKTRSDKHNFVEFKIPEEAKVIISKYKGTDGRIMLTDNQRSDKLHSFFLRTMPLLANTVGIKKIIYYSARKSFSQHALNLGIRESVIDYILGHKVERRGTSLFSYVTITREMATEAIRKVLDNLR